MATDELPRLRLAHLPTPLERLPAGVTPGLDRAEIWLKRDDATGGAEAGNKIRKLEFLLGDARAHGATHVVTCGGLQSNHARATALLAARLGLRATLLLRVAPETLPPGTYGPHVETPGRVLPRAGNVLLDRLAGATVRIVSPAEWADRNACMGAIATELAGRGERPYVIPEGGSNGIGSLGYVHAMREIREQLDVGLGGGPRAFDVIVHACGSGGTAAGVAVGAATYGVARGVRAVCVCDDAEYFAGVVRRIVGELLPHDRSLVEPLPIVFDEDARGPRYAEMSAEQRRFLVTVGRRSGYVLDPVYTGKALFALDRALLAGTIPEGARVLFLHTGGLPGLLAQGDAFAEEL
jgi:D-cysteine desulfhydrase